LGQKIEAVDPGRAPLRVFLAHPLNEITQATIDLRAPCPLLGFPARGIGTIELLAWGIW
jgi:hypothetical protein